MSPSSADAQRERIVRAAEQLVRERLGAEATGRDWHHADRVRRIALRIAANIGADPFVCELAALLHDLADRKLVADEEKAVRELNDWLREQGVPAETADHVTEIVATMSYHDGRRPPMRTPEGMAVQDADRLDAIGAIGIARTFAYSGRTGRPIYAPAEEAKTGGGYLDAGRAPGGQEGNRKGGADRPDEHGTSGRTAASESPYAQEVPRVSERPHAQVSPRRSGEEVAWNAPEDAGDPAIAPRPEITPSAIAHFYEKLLLLKSRLNTAEARAIAEQRHRFMTAFLEQFYAEWEGGR